MAYHPSQLDLQIDSIYSTAVPTLCTHNILSGSYKLNTITDCEVMVMVLVMRLEECPVSSQERRREAGRCELR